MTNANNAQQEQETDSTKPHAIQINVKMQQGEHTGQPFYSNFTSIQGGQRIVIVDFGFLDPKTINAVNRPARSGEKVPDTVDARMSCRMVISIEAASNLVHQLNQLLHKKT
jgi:hypothetical protein